MLVGMMKVAIAVIIHLGINLSHRRMTVADIVVAVAADIVVDP